MRDTGGPDHSFDTLKPKYNLILWQGVQNPRTAITYFRYDQMESFPKKWDFDH